MGQDKHITKKNNRILWALRSIRNWFQKWWMWWHGYSPIIFHPYDNAYTYGKDGPIEDESPKLEIVHCTKDKTAKAAWYHSKTRVQKNLQNKRF